MQYKNHLSGFKEWDQIEHCEDYILYSKNIGKKISIDEVNLSNGELYTVITNKGARGKRGAIIAMCKGTKVSEIAVILNEIPLEKRKIVEEITLDMSDSMDAIVRQAFPNAVKVTDRFHVQQLVSEAVQEIRIDIRKKVIKEENEKMKECREKKIRYRPELYKNGDTKKQLLARSRYLLFKPKSKWSERQLERSKILFAEYPEIKSAYDLSMMFRNCYETNFNIADAKKSFEKWYKKIKEKNIDSFLTAAESIRLRETTILNYFINRSTNASAESFNAKLKGFRTVVRGIRDKKFHLFRIARIFG